MDSEKEFKKLELERQRKQNKQIDVEIAYRKIELALLKKELAKP